VLLSVKTISFGWFALHERFAMNIVILNIQVIFIACCIHWIKMHFTKYNWNITLYFAWEFWFTNSELYWIGHWYHITSIYEGFYEPNSKAIESWNYMMCFVIWPSVSKSNSEDWEKARLWDHKKSMCLMYFIIFGILQNLTAKTLEIAFQRL
jgi:hypothetical protein